MAIPFQNSILLCLNFFFFFISTSSDNYIVHMDMFAKPTVFPTHHNWYMATLASAVSEHKTKKLPSSNHIYTYDHVINGFSATLTPAELEAIRNTPGFVYVMRDLSVKAHSTRSMEFLGLNYRSEPWKLTDMGEGVVIGVIDSGIWPESESFADEGIPEPPLRWRGECETGDEFNSSMCNRKLIGARYFNRGWAAMTPNFTFHMNSTRDTEGHGTHTSSTAAGNFVRGASYFRYAPGTARGAAPKAHLAVYKVMWDGYSVSSDILAAIDRAISDGVDVISLSLGMNVPIYEDPVGIATLAAVERNIFVSTSAGNYGPLLMSLHNGVPWVLTVASGTLDRQLGGVLRLENGDSIPGLSLYPLNFTAGLVPIVSMGACLDVKQLAKANGTIVVCRDKHASLRQQAINIAQVNVSGAVFITDSIVGEPEMQSPFPCLFVDLKDGEAIMHYTYTTKGPRGTLEFQKTTIGYKGAPTVAWTSSRGPSPSCPSVLKPDVMAPGEMVLAAWPSDLVVIGVFSEPLYSKFNILSGTSMACPHAAGVAALIKKVHPGWSPAAIRSAMMTTADTMNHVPKPIMDMAGWTSAPATPLAMGSGQVNPSKALHPGLIYDLGLTDYTRLICAMNLTEQQIKTITRSSKPDCSDPSLDLNYPSFIAFVNSSSKSTTVQTFHRTVTNVGKAASNYTSRVTPIAGFNVTVLPDKLMFKSKNQRMSFRLILECTDQLERPISYRYLKWVEEEGKYEVKSPIVATSLSLDMFT